MIFSTGRTEPSALHRLFVAALVLVASAGASARGSSADPGVRFIGRVSGASTDAMRFGWPGSTLVFAFEGSRLTVELSDGGDNSADVEVDGKMSKVQLMAGRHSYDLAASLPSGLHEVRLVRRTEGFFGPTTFHKATTDGTFVPVRERPRRILVIGDSISAGYGIEGADASCKFSKETENQNLTYAAVAGRAFDAEVVAIAFSGIGAARNYNGETRDTMPTIWERAIPTEPASMSDDGAFDVVVVNLGTNDFGGATTPGTEFGTAYTQLMHRVRARNPNSMIYATIGPILSADKLEAAARAINGLVDKLKDEGDKKIGFLRFAPLQPNEYGCDWHPNSAGHKQMARLLIDRIGSDMSWQPAARQPDATPAKD